ncbi:MAG: hypothetical protein IIA70_06670 [Proteobacteria bacterium]|nr:hypothetical protein [Pseudomonadota bacterium]
MMIFRFLLSFLMAVLMMASQPFAEEATDAPDGITEPIPVTVEELVSNPAPYAGKKVLVKGFLIFRLDQGLFCSAILFSSLQDYLVFNFFDYGLDANTPILGFQGCDNEIFSPNIAFQRTLVEIVGIYDLDCNSNYVTPEGYSQICLHHWGDGDLVDIQSLKLLEQPRVPSLLLKYITQYHYQFDDEGPREFYFEVEDETTEAQSAKEFLKRWIGWVKYHDSESLINTYLDSFEDYSQDALRQDLRNTESFTYKFLFSPEFLLQRYLRHYAPNEIALLKEKNFSEEFYEEGGQPEKQGCFCLSSDCTNLWPPTKDQIRNQGLKDDFICITLYRKEEDDWRWFF